MFNLGWFHRLALIGFGVFILAAPLLVSGQTPPASPPVTFKPEVPLATWGGDIITVSPTTIADYIRAVFVLFIWSVGGLAVVMVTYGGVRWVSAAGNPGRINQARETVNNALIGLIIALTSFVLLNLIDRRLTNFQGLTIGGVNSNPLIFDNVVGVYGESSANGCKTRSGKIIRQESSCFVNADAFVWPVADATQNITSHVGLRSVKGASGASTCHAGTDFSTDRKTGKFIRAAHAGTVEIPPSVGSPKVGNEFVIIVRANGYFTRYLHISQLIAQNGQRIGAGDLLGASGGDPKVAGGVSSGPHLHVELYSSSGELHDLAACLFNWNF